MNKLIKFFKSIKCLSYISCMAISSLVTGFIISFINEKILTFIGLFATIAGTYLAYITYLNPMIRFNWYLSNTSCWERFNLSRTSSGIFRYKKYPTFQIVIDYGSSQGFNEDWIPHFPNNIKRKLDVNIEVNGLILGREYFISLDGGRYFIPLPNIENIDGQNRYYYTKQQIKIANIIGEYYRGDNIFDFIREHNINISLKN